MDLDTADAADTRAADASRELQQELAAARAAERDLEAQVRGSAEVQIGNPTVWLYKKKSSDGSQNPNATRARSWIF